MTENTQKKFDDVELGALVILGWILPLAGFVYGPGQWWTYVIWLLIGTAAVALYAATHES